MSAFRERPHSPASYGHRWTNGDLDSFREGDQVNFEVLHQHGGYACGVEESVSVEVSRREGNERGVGEAMFSMPFVAARAFANAILEATGGQPK